MGNIIKINGIIEFEIPNKTKKHHAQSEWKRVAMIKFSGEDCEYYAWFINRRYSIKLCKPIRNAHITFINDKLNDIAGETQGEKLINWDTIKNKYNKKRVSVTLSVDPRTNGVFWWLNIPHENRGEIQSIRDELGLGKPYFGLHMTIGRANHLELEQSEYIHRLIENKIIF